MILIKARAPVALVGGHYIYHCEETILRAVSPVTGNKNAEEARLLASFQGVDMTKNFYFRLVFYLFRQDCFETRPKSIYFCATVIHTT